MLTVGTVILPTHNQAIPLHVCVSRQLEAADCDPLDELYDALAEVVGTEDTNQCYKSYLLVLIDFDSAYLKGPEEQTFLCGTTLCI